MTVRKQEMYFMKKTILLYNFNDEDFRTLKLTFLPLKFSAVKVSIDEYNQPVGFLAGDKDILRADDQYSGEQFDGRLIVICGALDGDLDKILTVLRKNQSAKGAIKAVLTSVNRNWSGQKLYEEVKAEHQLMTKKRKTSS